VAFVCGTLGLVPEVHAARSDVQHVVIILKENHTTDNLFGGFPGADTAKLRLRTPLPFAPNINHTRAAALIAYDDGLMDGFLRIPPGLLGPLESGVSPGRPWSESQYTEKELPIYWSWARQYVLGDEFFTSVMGPSFPNHLFSLTATSFGAVDNPNSRWWGCDAPQLPGYYNTTVLLADGQLVFPCFDGRVLQDELDDAGISWKFYGPLPDQSGYVWSSLDAIKHIRFGPDWRKVVAWQEFVEDAKEDQLPAVSWLVAPTEVSDHPPEDELESMHWTAAQVAAVQASPAWQSTVIFITFDDFGGFYDHVPPPQVDDTGFGFRAPLLIVSPLVKSGYIDHSVSDFSSLVKFEDRWGLVRIGARDADAGDLSDALR
jgi:phospholipase C